MKYSTMRTTLIACLLTAAPLSLATAPSAMAQNQPQQQPSQQPQPQQQQQPQPPQHPQPQPLGQRPPPSSAPPQFQHPTQAAPPPQYQRPAQGGPPSGTSPQFQRPVQNATPQPPYRAPSAVQAAPQQQAPRANFQAAPYAAPNRTPTANANFASHHFGAPPTQFRAGLFYGRDYAHFTPTDRTRWQHGTWHHEFINGRYGWWFVVDDIWYFYDAPVYPYPTFIPEVVYIPDDDYYADDYDDDSDAPPPVTAPTGAPAGNYYYFCPDSQTYYPYVTSCPSPWQLVPLTPPPQ